MLYLKKEVPQKNSIVDYRARARPEKPRRKRKKKSQVAEGENKCIPAERAVPMSYSKEGLVPTNVIGKGGKEKEKVQDYEDTEKGRGTIICKRRFRRYFFRVAEEIDLLRKGKKKKVYSL